MSSGVSRLALWNEIAGVSVVEPILMAAYEREEIRAWRSGSDDSPHGQRWHTSFHASQFPGSDPRSCARAAVYGLMGLPDPDPIIPRLRAWFDLGKNLELDWVKRFTAEGVLLTVDQNASEDVQTGFVDREHWLTGASDAIILPAFWAKGHCVEVKTTSHEKVVAMRNDLSATPNSHEKYIRQLKAYISLAHEAPFAPTVVVCSESWAITKEIIPGSPLRWCPVHENVACPTQEITLEPPDDGTLIYSSREEPLTTASYYFSIDEEEMAIGRAKLAQYRDAFIAGEIPEHPRDKEKAKWSVDPCRLCGFKKRCKIDYQQKIVRLSESHQIEWAQSVIPSYDYASNRSEVLARWGASDTSEREQSEGDS